MLLDTRFNNLTKEIIGCAMGVHRELGSGFPELIYQRGLAVELTKSGVVFQGQVSLPVFYKDQVIGARRADFWVESQFLVELKAVGEVTGAHYAQTINYLKAYRLGVALLISFGEPSLKFKRLLHNPVRLT